MTSPDFRAGWDAADQYLQDAHDLEIAQARIEGRPIKNGRLKMLQMARRMLARNAPEVTGQAEPERLVLRCPACEQVHLDQLEPDGADWSKRPHKTHLCKNTLAGPDTGCGHKWRPKETPTVGIAPLERLKGEVMARMTDEELHEIEKRAHASGHSDIAARRALVRAGVEQAIEALRAVPLNELRPQLQVEARGWASFLEQELKAGRLV